MLYWGSWKYKSQSQIILWNTENQHTAKEDTSSQQTLF